MSWDGHATAVVDASSGTCLEATIFNKEGTTFCAPGAKFLKDLTVAEKQTMIKIHDQQSHAAFVLNFGGKPHRFQNVKQEEDFTLWSFSGDLGGVQKPVLILARTKTAAVMGLFTKRDANVQVTCTVAGNLKNSGI